MTEAVAINAGGSSLKAALIDDRTPDWIPLAAVFEEIMRRRESKKVAIFTGLLFAFATIQSLYAVSIDSLGLLSDGLHLFFHCAALSISLLGMVYSRRPATFAFSYGYSRAEVLAAFSNALFLVFLVLYVMASGLQRLVQPAEFSTDTVLSLEFGLIGLAINVAGVVVLGPGSSTFDQLSRFTLNGGSSSSSSGGAVVSPHNSAATGFGFDIAAAGNREAVLLTFLSDAVSSLAVIVSSLLVRYRGMAAADTLQCFATGIFTLWLVIPLFTATAKILLQTVPQGIAGQLDKCRRQLTIIDGVLDVAEEHWWLQTPGHPVGSLSLRVRHDVSEHEVLQKAQKIYQSLVPDLTIQIEKEPAPLSSSSSSSSSSSASASSSSADSHHGHSHSHGHSHGHGSSCSGHHH